MSWMLLSALATAGEMTVAAEIDRLHSPSEAFGWDGAFDINQTEVDALAPKGVRVEYNLGRVSAVASSGWSRRSTSHYFQEGEQHYDLTLNTFVHGVGAKVHLRPPSDELDRRAAWFDPYVLAQGRLIHAGLRLDDDRYTEGNLNELTQRGLGFGFVTSAGFSMDLGPQDWKVLPVVYVDMGYQWSTELDMGDTGSFRFRGYQVRGGMGVSF